MTRDDLMDAKWRVVDRLLPDRGERILLWGSAPRRVVLVRYGDWNTVCVRFTRSSKPYVWYALLETLATRAARSLSEK